MATELYGNDPAFSATVDSLLARMGHVGQRLRREWLDGTADVPLADASRAQPLLYVIELAIAYSLLESGLVPRALLGHSIGEMVAATLAGVIDVDDAPDLLRARVEATAEAPDGGMLAVHAAAEELTTWLAERPGIGQVEVGAVNAPEQTVLVGPEPELSQVDRLLRAEGRSCRRVGARQPFHGRLLATCASRSADSLSAVRLRAPTVPVRSTRTGRWLADDEAADPWFWASQISAPVLFWTALDGLLTDLAGEDPVLVEIGPGTWLGTLARQHPALAGRPSPVVATVPRPGAGTEWRDWCSALDTLAEHGVLNRPRSAP